MQAVKRLQAKSDGRRQGQAPRSFDPLMCLRVMNMMRASVSAAMRGPGA